MSLFGIFIFLLVLGVLVFVHELGHFLAAKACNVYVDRFSLGMPPRVAGFKFGETDYCIGLLPIGGYVKMAGQEDAPLSDEEREGTYGHVPEERWFNKKPIYQRAIILAAGPLMNLVLAFGIYAFLAAVGTEVPMMEVEARVGLIETGSAASTAPMYRISDDNEKPDFSAPPDTEGWLTGDVILAVNGKKMNRFRDVVIEAVLGGGKKAVV
ncbi:MAG: site-2 protease family protein, partial [Candidatus Hydrogenedentes bacterium]|nr:site-2 protease family protein [Candidatus Hydrogenedentota bacterium]